METIPEYSIKQHNQSGGGQVRKRTPTNAGRLITLNEAEIRLARWLAKKRYSNSRKEEIKNNKIGPQSDEFTDLNGIGAEIAFCKLINVYPDTSISPRGGGCDCISCKGKRIDVKATKYENGKLLAARDKKDADTDVYVLMVGEFPAYQLKGWAFSSELIDKDNIIDLGYGPTYALEQDALHKVKSNLK